MKIFTDYRRFFWIGAVVFVIAGFIVAALLPLRSDPGKDLGPAVSVPKMQNVPPDNQPIRLDVDEKKQ